MRLLIISFLCVFFMFSGFSQGTHHLIVKPDSAGKNKFGCVNWKTKDTILQPIYDKIDGIRNFGARYRVGENWGLLDSACRVVLSTDTFRWVYRHYIDGSFYWVAGRQDFKNELYNDKFELVLSNFKTIQPLNHLITVVQKDSLFGLMNSKFELIIPYKYHFIHKIEKGYARTILGEYSGFIDAEGNDLIKPRYKISGSVNSNRLCVRSDGKSGYLNTKDELVIPLRFVASYQFYDGFARGAVVKEQDTFPRHRSNLIPKIGLIDTNGNWVIAPIYQRIYRMRNNYYTAYNDVNFQDTFYVENLKKLPDYHFAHNVIEGFGVNKNLAVIMQQEGRRLKKTEGLFHFKSRDPEFNKMYFVVNTENDTLTKKPFEYMAYDSTNIFLKHYGKWKYYDQIKEKVKPVRKLDADFYIVKYRSYDEAPMRLGVISRKGHLMINASFDTIELVNGEFICENKRAIQRINADGKYLGVIKLKVVD